MKLLGYIWFAVAVAAQDFYFFHQGLSENRIGVFVSPQLPAFFYHIRHVIGLRSYEEMIWIDAKGVITQMADIESSRNSTFVNGPAYAMRCPTTVTVNVPVSRTAFLPCPRPAFSQVWHMLWYWSFFIDVGPELIFYRHGLSDSLAPLTTEESVSLFHLLLTCSEGSFAYFAVPHVDRCSIVPAFPGAVFLVGRDGAYELFAAAFANPRDFWFHIHHRCAPFLSSCLLAHSTVCNGVFNSKNGAIFVMPSLVTESGAAGIQSGNLV